MSVGREQRGRLRGGGGQARSSGGGGGPRAGERLGQINTRPSPGVTGPPSGRPQPGGGGPGGGMRGSYGR